MIERTPLDDIRGTLLAIRNGWVSGYTSEDIAQLQAKRRALEAGEVPNCYLVPRLGGEGVKMGAKTVVIVPDEAEEIAQLYADRAAANQTKGALVQCALDVRSAARWYRLAADACIDSRQAARLRRRADGVLQQAGIEGAAK